MKANSAPDVSSPHAIVPQIEEQFQGQVQPDMVRQAALATLAHLEFQEPFELAVVVTGDEMLHELNLRYREVDRPTDVLAFPAGARGPFVDAPDEPRYLGDVIVSFHRAEAQAANAGHTVLAELQLLVVHGVLHLLGFDDVVEQGRARMWAVQAEILQRLGVEVHLPA